MPDEIRFSLLGQLRAWRGEESLTLGPPQQQAMLAVLLLASGRPVSKSEIIDTLWGERVPRGAESTVRTYASRLRRALEAGADVITRTVSGYVLHYDEGAVDLDAFRQHVREGQHARRQGDLAVASDSLRRALELWAGTPLAGLPGQSLENARTQLNEAYWDAVVECFEIDLELGRHVELAPKIAAAVAEGPFNERLRELSMLALYRSGRQAEALALFRETRRLLAEDLGIEPGPGLVRMHERILAADPALLNHAHEGIRLNQLPPAPGGFVGRTEEIARVVGLITGSPARAVAIEGLGGRGKTALALHIAHQVEDRFPDGLLYAELGTKTEKPADPATVLTAFLEALGMPARAQPALLDQKASAWRNILVDKRVLMVLDDVYGAEQVRHLLPPRSGSAAIITTARRWMTNTDLDWLVVPDLDADEAVEALAELVGHERVAAEPVAAQRLVELCGCNPLAIRVSGLRLAARKWWTLAEFTDRIADQRCDQVAGRDRELVEAPLRRAEATLTAEEVEVFRRGATVCESVISADFLASVMRRPEREVIQLLEGVSEAHLLDGLPDGAYRYSQLVRDYACRAAKQERTPVRAHLER